MKLTEQYCSKKIYHCPICGANDIAERTYNNIPLIPSFVALKDGTLADFPPVDILPYPEFYFKYEEYTEYYCSNCGTSVMESSPTAENQQKNYKKQQYMTYNQGFEGF